MLTNFLKGKKATADPIRVYVVDPPYSYVTAYKRWIDSDIEMTVVKSPKDADVILFTGGSDISPSIYHQPSHHTTRPNQSRDHFEISMYLMASDKLKVGICRGAQLLNVLSGGSIIQHVEGHASPHNLKLLQEGGQIIRNVPSTHHQMMLPSKKVLDRSILAVACSDKDERNEFISTPHQKHVPRVMAREKYKFLNSYRTMDFNPYTQDAEIIYYRNTDSLCIQSHPEKRDCPGPFTAYCNALIVARARQTRLRIKQETQKSGEKICVDT